MAYDLTKLLRMKSLKELATYVEDLFARKTAVNAISARVDTLEETGGEANVITGIKVNGAVQAPTDKVVDIAVPTKVSDIENDSGYQTETDVAALIAASAHLSRKIVESVAAINVSAADAEKYVYLVPKPDGDENENDSYDEYMVLNGKAERVGDWKVDLGDYVKKETGKGLSSNDYSTEEKTKLAGISAQATRVTAEAGSGTINIDGTDVVLFEHATDAEVVEMLNEVFGAS